MKTQIAKWGNSLAVRIPKPLIEAAKLRAGDDLDVDVERSGAIRLRKWMRKADLRELVRGVTADNIHAATDWGEPVGKELW